MPTGTITSNVSVAGISIQSSLTRTASGQIAHEKTLAKAEGGTLTTRTSNTVGTLTMTNSSHGILTADIIDIYFVGGVRYKVTVGTVAGTAVPISLGAGTNLPVVTTTIEAAVVTTIDTDFVGDLSVLLASYAKQRGHITWLTSAGAVIAAQELTANEVWDWVNGTPTSNPLTGQTVASVQVSNGDTASTNLLKIGVLYNS